MNNVFKEIAEIDSDRLVKESLDIIEQVGWENMQICLQYSALPSWHDDVDHYGQSRREENCTNFHPELEGTYIKEVLTSFGVNVASARFMWLDKRSCYSTHVDLYTRYHIPIVSNPLMSYMVFPDLAYIARMPLGKVYWTNTHELHNFVNGDHSPRIHLIFNSADELPNLDNPYLEKLGVREFAQKLVRH